MGSRSGFTTHAAKLAPTEFQDPCVGMTYAPSGAGKTTDMIYSFPCALFICDAGATKSSKNLIGVQVASVQHTAFTFGDVGAQMLDGVKKGFREFVCDDGSLIAQNTYRLCQKKYGKSWNASNAFKDMLIDLRQTARDLGCHVMMNFHETSMTMKDGAMIRGGPKLPEKKLTEDFPTIFDLVLRAQHDPNMRRAGYNWTGSYRCTQTEVEWFTKDRHHATPDKAPMNLAEILRAAGYRDIPRMKGLEWQETIVEQGAQALLAGYDATKVKYAIVEMARAYTSVPQHIGWCIRDAFDRAELRARQAMFLTEHYGIQL